MAVPLIIMAIGTAAKAYAQNQAEQRNLQAEEDAYADQAGFQDKIDQSLNGMVAGMKNSSPDKYAAQTRSDYLKALDTAMPGSTENVNGGNSYNVGKGQEALGQHNTAINLADLLAKVTGPAEQRRMQGYQIANTGSNVGELANFARGQYGADMTGANAQPNNGLEMLGNLAMAYGMNKLGQPTQGKN